MYRKKLYLREMKRRIRGPLEVVRVLVIKEEWTRKALWQPGSHTEKCSSVTQCGLLTPIPGWRRYPEMGSWGAFLAAEFVYSTC